MVPVAQTKAPQLIQILHAPVGPNSYNDRMCTFLKAFYGAPCFTRTELNAVCNAVSNCFPGSKVVNMPTDASLQKDYQSNVAERFAKPHRLIKPIG